MSSSGTMDHKCQHCGAVLKFNPHGQNWVCEYCKSEYNKAEIDAYEASRGVEKLTSESEKVKLEKDLNGMDIYSCPNCGAQIVADENTSATFCVYCKSTAILKNKLIGEFNPSEVIPFHKTREDAILAFKKLGKGKPLMPKEFSNHKNIDDMRGVYIPFWLYDYNVNGNIVADAKRIRSWVSGGYRYTKTDTYRVDRAGNMRFNKVPVDGSTHFDNSVMNSIEPFDYNGLVEFSPSYLSGFLAEKYDVDSETAKTEALRRTQNSTTDILRSDVIGYTSVVVTGANHNVNLNKSEYVLLPVWLLNIKYKDKLYTFAMNGQTGKLIGDIPVDKKKAVLYWILGFAVIMVILTIIWLI